MRVHEIKQLKQALHGIEMLDIETELFAAQFCQRIFKGGDIERGLAAEMLVDHARIGAGFQHDAADAGAGKAVGGEFGGGRAHDLLAALLRGAPRAAQPRCEPGAGFRD